MRRHGNYLSQTELQSERFMAASPKLAILVFIGASCSVSAPAQSPIDECAPTGFPGMPPLIQRRELPSHWLNASQYPAT